MPKGRIFTYIIAVITLVTIFAQYCMPVDVAVWAETGAISIETAEQTLWIMEEDGIYKNEVLLTCNNTGEAKDIWVKITVNQHSEIQSVGTLSAGSNTVAVFVAEDSKEQTASIQLYDKSACNGTPLASTTVAVVPMRHWKIYVAQNMHMDIGFTTYQETLIDEFYPSVYKKALADISLSASWDWADQFKYPAEQSFLLYGAALRYPDASFYDALQAAVEKGNLTYPVSFSSSYLPAMGQEFLARYGYQSARYLTDMLGVGTSQIVNCTDVQGIPKGAIDTLVGSGAKYFVFRPNNDTTAWAHSRYPKLFYLTGNEEGNQLLTWSSYHYGTDELGFRGTRDAIGRDGNISTTFITTLSQKVVKNYQTERYFYDAILIDFTEGGDNGTYDTDVFYNIHSLNSRSKATGINYVYPQFIHSTETDFFQYIEENYEDEIPVYTQGFEEYWTHGMGTFAYETGLSKEVNVTLPAAETLATLTSVKFGELYPKKVLTDAYDNMNLWYEHTYGSGPSGCRLDEVWVWERSSLYAAKTQAETITANAMDTLTQNITTTGCSIVVYNSLSANTSNLTSVALAELPANFEITDTVTNAKVTYQIEGDMVYFVAENVPGNGYKTYLVTKTEKAPVFSTTAKQGENTLENKYFKLVFDNTGCLTSLYDKVNQKELVDKDAEYGFNQFIYLNTLTPAGSKNPVVGDILQVTAAELTFTTGPVFSTVTAKGNTGIEIAANGLERKMILYEALDKVDIENMVMKDEALKTTSQDEEVFFVFPFQMENFEINHETVSGILNPAKNSSTPGNPESQLMTGSALDFFTVNRWIDIGNQESYGIVFTPENSSLIQYGQRNSYAFLKELQIEKPYIYSWVMNNKWWTNHQKTQPGIVTFRYSVTPRTGENYVEGKSDLVGQTESTDLKTTVIATTQSGPLAANGQLIRIPADNVALTTAKLAEMNGDGIIFRFHENRGVDTTVSVDLSTYGIVDVRETNIVEEDLEENVHLISFENGVATFRIAGSSYVTLRGLLQEETVGAVSNITAIRDDKGTLLSWSKVEGASYYEIYRSAKADFAPGAGTYLLSTEDAKYFDNQVTTAQGTYYYIVKAVKKGTSGAASQTVAVTDGTLAETKAPTTPANLIVDSYYVGRISLVWNFSQDDVAVAGYWVYRNGEQYKYIEANYNSTLDYDLPLDGKATYTVRAVDIYGNLSADSNSVTVDTNDLGVLSQVPQNIGTVAEITASGFLNSEAVDASKTLYQPFNVVDGIAGVEGTGEWISGGEESPWITMTFNRPYTLDKINVYPRNSADDSIQILMISFSDDTTMSLMDLPSDGSCVTLDVSGKSVEWITFTITRGKGTLGLSEIEVLREMPAEPQEGTPQQPVPQPENGLSLWIGVGIIGALLIVGIALAVLLIKKTKKGGNV